MAEFFFSYARADDDIFLKRFFQELSDAVRVRRGLPRDAEIGFLDQDQERGEEWTDRLPEALQGCPVLIGLYSRAYFRSEYCGREWEVFRRRRDLLAAARRQAGGELPPPVIKPVLWVPLPDDELPPAVRSIQYTHGDPQSIYNQKGLRYLAKLRQRYQSEYDEYVEGLADEIVRVAENQPLPRLDALPPFLDLPNPFAPATAGAGDASPPAPLSHGPSGPRIVHFVFVAGRPEELAASRRTVDAYLTEGGRDWKPFFPEVGRPLRAVAQQVASEAEMDFFSQELALDEALAEKVREAENKREIVVVFVDRWTAGLARYRKILERFDRESYFNCSVLVPLNDSDSDANGRREELERYLQGALYRLSRTGESTFYRKSIRSHEELCNELRSVLIRLRAEIINRSTIERPVPEGRRLTLVHGPGSVESAA